MGLTRLLKRTAPRMPRERKVKPPSMVRKLECDTTEYAATAQTRSSPAASPRLTHTRAPASYLRAGRSVQELGFARMLRTRCPPTGCAPVKLALRRKARRVTFGSPELSKEVNTLLRDETAGRVFAAAPSGSGKGATLVRKR